MALEQRLKQIEQKLKPSSVSCKCEPQYLNLLDLPKETVIGAFSVIKEAGGYQLMFRPEEVAMMSKDELSELNQLTPVQFYEMIHLPVQVG